MFITIIMILIIMRICEFVSDMGAFQRKDIRIISGPTGEIMKIFIPDLYVRGVFFGFSESVAKQCQLNTSVYFYT